MEGDETGTHVGIIPRTITKIFEETKGLAEKGWKYKLEASFLEIYNEDIRDLLATEKGLKYDIKKVDAKSNEIYVTNLRKEDVTSGGHNIPALLKLASKNRAVAATNCNERSSRSHSVFMLKITGTNSITSESCTGTLNLVDLAGSERLKESGSTGLRLEETKNINSSLSNLSNVIMALASNKSSHIPYRDSKLTYLLMNSLGGNSKTLMFVNLSPREDTWNETLNSLRFAKRVNNCQIGTASKKVNSV
jgi:kinesin family protein C1